MATILDRTCRGEQGLEKEDGMDGARAINVSICNLTQSAVIFSCRLLRFCEEIEDRRPLDPSFNQFTVFIYSGSRFLTFSLFFSLFLRISRLLLLCFFCFCFLPSFSHLLFLDLSLSLSFLLCHSSYCFHTLSFSVFSKIYLSLSITLSSYHPLLIFLFLPSPLTLPLPLLPYFIALFLFQSWV